MDKEFVPVRESIEIRNLGFDEPCFKLTLNGIATIVKEKTSICLPISNSQVNNGVVYPLWQQAFRWFQEVHGLYVEPFVDDDKTFGFLVSYFIPHGRTDMPIQGRFKTTEERDIACIQFLIKAAKEKRV